MFHLKKIALSLVIISSITPTAQAVQYGSDLAESDYQDFYVKITTSGNSTCGGSLVGGKYLITAQHCTEDDGSDITSVTIYQGIEGEESYSRDVTVYSNNDSSSKSDMLIISESIWDEDVTSNYPTLYASGGLNYLFDSWSADEKMEGDLAILVLDSPVTHRTGKLIKPLYDTDSNTSNIPTGTDLMFWGWGKDENSELATTLQEMTLQTLREWVTPYSYYEYNATYNTQAYTECDESTDTSCTWAGKDTHMFYSIDSASSAEGDSGSPVQYDGAIYGVLSGSGSTYESIFEHFTLSMDLFKSVINDVVYPNGTGVEITEGDTNTYTIEVPVQNFTTENKELSLSITDATGYFVADFSDCETTLEPEDGCIIEVAFNTAGDAIYDEQTETLQITSAISTTIGAYFDSGSEESSSTSSGSGSSGGGSIGYLGLLLLGGLTTLRNKKLNK